MLTDFDRLAMNNPPGYQCSISSSRTHYLEHSVCQVAARAEIVKKKCRGRLIRSVYAKQEKRGSVMVAFFD